MKIAAIIEQFSIKNFQVEGIDAKDPGNTPENIISRAIALVLIVGAVLFLAMFLWAAISWITAGGDKEKIAAARRRIIQSIIGFTLLALSLFIVVTVGRIVRINILGEQPLPSLGTPVNR